MQKWMPKIVSTPSIYWNSFKLLYKDLEDSFRYVNPTQDHIKVYSLRYYELLIRACTEFESICKELVVEHKLSKKNAKEFSIKEYYLLNSHYENKPCETLVGYILSDPFFTLPLDEWREGHTLSWYKDYNKVKHNKSNEFQLANLENVLKAIGALFIMIERAKLCPRGELSFHSQNTVLSHPDWPVVLKKEY